MNKLIKHLLISIIGLCYNLVGLAADKTLLKIEHWKTQKGVPVYFIANHELPMLDVLVGFYAGSIYDGKLLGLATLTNNSLANGTKQHDADSLAEQFANAGAQFNSTVSHDLAAVSLRTLTQPAKLNSALKPFIEILQQPSFPNKEVARERDNLLAVIQYQQQQPDVIAEKTFNQLLFQNHPYAHWGLGTPETLAQITRSDVVKFYQRYYVAQNALIVMVGDQNLSQAKALAEQISNQLANGTRAPAITANNFQIKPQQKIINFPSEQTHIILGQRGVGYQDPDFIPLTVGNHILGGHGLTSLLFQEIRKKRGLTYGAYSQIAPGLYGSSFTITLATRNEQAAQAIAATQDLLQSYTKQGPDTKQLELAKQFLIGSLPLQLANNSTIANALFKIAAYQLPLNYYDNYKDQVQKLDQQTIVNAWRKHVQPHNLIIVQVGNRVK